MKARILLEDFPVATVHAIADPWVVLKLPDSFSPRFLHLKVGDIFNINLTIDADPERPTVIGEAEDTRSMKELISEVARKLGV